MAKVNHLTGHSLVRAMRTTLSQAAIQRRARQTTKRVTALPFVLILLYVSCGTYAASGR